MHKRLLLSTWFVRSSPLANLLKRYCASVVSCPDR
jgi:hypothetical protein